MPMPYPREHFQPLLRLLRPQFAENLLTPGQWGALVLVPRNDQHWTLDLGVLRGRRELDRATICNIPVRLLREEHLTDEPFLERGGAFARRAVGDRVGHGLHAALADGGDALTEHVCDGGRRVDGPDADAGENAVGRRGGEVRRHHPAHGVSYHDSGGDGEVVEQRQGIGGDAGDGGVSLNVLGAAGAVVVEDDAPVAGQVGEDREIVVLRGAETVDE